MFITVRYGDNKELLFNPNCRNEVLLRSIKRRCHCQHDDVVDLSDESGLVKNLHRNLAGYATEHLREREVTILLKVQKNDSSVDEQEAVYIPLLRSLENDKEFTGKLNPTPSAHGRRSEPEGRTSVRTAVRRTAMITNRRASVTSRRNSVRSSLGSLNRK